MKRNTLRKNGIGKRSLEKPSHQPFLKNLGIPSLQVASSKEMLFQLFRHLLVSQQHPLVAVKPPGQCSRRRQITEQRCTRETIHTPQKDWKQAANVLLVCKHKGLHVYLLAPFFSRNSLLHTTCWIFLDWVESFIMLDPQENNRREEEALSAYENHDNTDLGILNMKWETVQIKF